MKGLLKSLISLTTSFILLSVSFYFPAGYSVVTGKIQLLRLVSTRFLWYFSLILLECDVDFENFFPPLVLFNLKAPAEAAVMGSLCCI